MNSLPKMYYPKSLLLKISTLMCCLFFASASFAQLTHETNQTLLLPNDTPNYSEFELINAFPSLPVFERPVAIVSPPNETNILFIVEQPGRIQRIQQLDTTPIKSLFMEIDVSGNFNGYTEQGILGLAFHPNFSENRFFYIYYTFRDENFVLTDRLSRFTAPTNWATDGLVDLSTELALIHQQDQAGNHNGGDLHFGPDEYLYISLGDEGGANDSYENSQTITKDFFSGILRIDVDKLPSNLEPNTHAGGAIPLDNGQARYRIPYDNPFVGATTFNGEPIAGNVRSEFWATGLRNPWRMSFDPLTGKLFTGDVGQNQREEVHVIERGDNCGWSYREGSIDGPNPNAEPNGFSPIEPIFEYPHNGGGKSVIGGRVYRANGIPQLFGKYILADAYDGRIWALSETAPGSGQYQDELLMESGNRIIAAFGEHPGTKELLVANNLNGQIDMLVVAGSATHTLPTLLSETGAFSDLSTLSPSDGVISYQPNVAYWSDGALKTRWFALPSNQQKITWAKDANWTFPSGMVWIQHFDLRTDLGEPAIWKKVETRFLVKSDEGAYGITYRWNNTNTEAELVPAEGMQESFVITQANDTQELQTWSYPSRSQCVQCHTEAGGYALSFNTRQLNRTNTYNGLEQNQIEALFNADFFTNTNDPVHTLSRLISLEDDTQSLHVRALSYLDVNCAGCHQPNGPAPSNWNGLFSSPFVDANIYEGLLQRSHSQTNTRFTLPNNADNSAVLHSMAGTDGYERMPPVGVNLRDGAAETLITNWINDELMLHAPYTPWRNSFEIDPGEAHEDPDGDGANNALERLTRTDPNDAFDYSHYTAHFQPEEIILSHIQRSGLHYQWQMTTNWVDWQPLETSHTDYSINQKTNTLSFEPQLDHAFFRLQIQEP